MDLRIYIYVKNKKIGEVARGWDLSYQPAGPFCKEALKRLQILHIWLKIQKSYTNPNWKAGKWSKKGA